jgi:hypothetical protein
MSDAALGWVTILVFTAVAAAVVTLVWRHKVRTDAEGFYRRLRENLRKSAESDGPMV